MLKHTHTEPAARVTRTPFGRLPDGTLVDLYTIASDNVRLSVTSYGARVVSLETRDRDGQMADIALGYGSVEGYVADNKCYLGCIAGRFANRIAGGRFTLDGREFQVPTNNGANALHGGPEGFDRQNWTAIEAPGGVEFTLISPDGDQGFPGELSVKVSYTVEHDCVRIAYYATTSHSTVINLTNHAYFNLAGESAGSILGHTLELACDAFTPVNENLIPTGQLAPVEGTAFDFRQPRRVGERIADSHPQLALARGYDHNWVVNGAPGTLRVAARLADPVSGRTLTVETTEPGVQMYTGNFLEGEFTGKSGQPYGFRSGICLETQHFPDSPNQPAFPSTTLRSDEVFRSETVWLFGAR